MDPHLLQVQQLGWVAEGVAHRQPIDHHAQRGRAEEERVGRTAHRHHPAVAAGVGRHHVEAGHQSGQTRQARDALRLEQVQSVTREHADCGRIILHPFGIDDGRVERLDGLGVQGGKAEGKQQQGGAGIVSHGWFVGKIKRESGATRPWVNPRICNGSGSRTSTGYAAGSASLTLVFPENIRPAGKLRAVAGPPRRHACMRRRMA